MSFPHVFGGNLFYGCPIGAFGHDKPRPMRLPNTILFFTLVSLFYATINCKSDEPLQPKTDNPPTVDTTSHNFTWTTYTFAGNYGSSYFKDVAIINDSNIWAVGLIYTSPETTFNAAHWDGKKWGFVKATSVSLNSVFAFNANDVWVGSSAPYQWNGISWKPYNVTGIFNGHIYKFWGTSSQNVYMVGTNGAIAHFDGNMWTKQESGTTIDLRDVWGSADGKTVWACGWSYDNFKSILLKYDGSIWKTIWSRDDLTSVPPFEYFATSVWGDKSMYLSTGRGVCHISEKETTKTVILPWFPYRIRGSNENNIAVAGDEGMIWHYNGAN